MKPLPLLAILSLSALAGCVERKMIITSDPPGALVYVNDVEAGVTPLDIPFTWYGDYDIILRMADRESITTNAEINPPWYEWPPLDLLSALAPWTYEDRRYLHYELKPLVQPPADEMIRRADDFRQRAAQEPFDLPK